MKFIAVVCILSQFLTIALSEENFKTIPLCMEKTPRNIRRDWKPNHDEMRELMLRAVILNEDRLVKGSRYNSNSPNASERSHVGTKTPV